MKLRQIFESSVNEVALIFGRFNPPHKGHRAAWEIASESPEWYVGTNKSTQGPKDPLPFDVKIEAMKTIWPDVEGHIIAETSWLTAASMIYKKHGDITLLCLTDEDWVTKTIKDYNGKEGTHGYYNFSNIKQKPTPRLSSATALRDAVIKGDRDAFAQAAGVEADTEVAGKPFFDLVAEYLLPYQNAPKKTSAKKKKETEVTESSIGWMLKQSPELAAKVKAKIDLAKKRRASYGNPDAGKSFNYKQDDWSADFERRMKQGVEEGGLLKSIKRGLKGWQGSSHLDDIQDYIRNASDRTLVRLYKDPGESPYKQTPRDIQIKLINRELKRRYGVKPGEPGVAEGMFGLSAKEKGKIQYVTAKISDIPGNWDHKNQTYTEQGLKDLKSVMKNEKYLKYALSLTSKDYDADLEEGWGDFSFKVNGWEYRAEEEDYDDVRKIFHTAISPNGEEISIDFSPYSAMDEETFKAWIDMGMPTRKDLDKRAPLDKEDLVGSSEKESLEETYDGDDFFLEYGVMWYNEDEILDEAEYQGRKVPLGKPMRGDVKKFKVYVKDPGTGNIKKVNFGDPNMTIKKSNPARRKSFRARHNCDNPGPRTKARYWSCRKW